MMMMMTAGMALMALLLFAVAVVSCGPLGAIETSTSASGDGTVAIGPLYAASGTYSAGNKVTCTNPGY